MGTINNQLVIITNSEIRSILSTGPAVGQCLTLLSYLLMKQNEGKAIFTPDSISNDLGWKEKDVINIHGILTSKGISGVPNLSQEEPTAIDEVIVDVPRGIGIIIDFWNSMKDETQRPWHVCLRPSQRLISGIQSAIRISGSVDAVLESISNYFSIYNGDEYWYKWTFYIQDFFLRGDTVNMRSPRKWEKFAPDNFDANRFRSENGVPDDNPALIVARDKNKELTEDLIKLYGKIINNTEYTAPNIANRAKFVVASDRFMTFCAKRKIPVNELIQILEDLLKEQYIDKEVTLWPGHLAGDTLWNVILPQYFTSL
jgi:hypothetical protein